MPEHDHGLDLDLDLEALVGPLDDVPCEEPIHRDGQVPAAAYYCVCLCCPGHAVAVCEACLPRIIQRWESWKGVYCNFCPAGVSPGTQWRLIRRFEPIPKGPTP